MQNGTAEGAAYLRHGDTSRPSQGGGSNCSDSLATAAFNEQVDPPKAGRGRKVDALRPEALLERRH